MSKIKSPKWDRQKTMRVGGFYKDPTPPPHPRQIDPGMKVTIEKNSVEVDAEIKTIKDQNKFEAKILKIYDPIDIDLAVGDMVSLSLENVKYLDQTKKD